MQNGNFANSHVETDSSNNKLIPLQKVAFKLDISASSGVNPESAF